MITLIKQLIQMASQQEPKGPPLLPQSEATYDTIDRRVHTTDSSSTLTGRDDNKSDTSSKLEGWRHPRVVSDIIIGLSDGLTVPFALTAGLSSLGDTKLVITGGLAELVSGAISMGLGGYLAAQSEAEYYSAQVEKEKASYDSCNINTILCMEDVLKSYGCLSPETVAMFSQDMQKMPDKMIEFVVQQYRECDEPANNRQFVSALTIGLAYFIGGFIPLIPYFFPVAVHTALWISAVIMGITLFVFGIAKTLATIGRACPPAKLVWNGVKMTLVGGVAAGCAYGLVRAIQ